MFILAKDDGQAKKTLAFQVRTNPQLTQSCCSFPVNIKKTSHRAATSQCFVQETHGALDTNSLMTHSVRQ